MALKDSLTAVQYYTQFDPYYYVVDNRPLVNLKDRDDALADKIDSLVFHIDITGGASPVVNKLPTGWSMVRNAVGDYTLTHSFNSLNYLVISGVTGTSPGFISSSAPGLNSFSIKTFNSAAAAADIRFSCIVSRF